MRNSEKWAALSVLVVSYACATGVVLEDDDYNLLNSVNPGSGGSETAAANGGSGGSGQSGNGPTPGSGGTAAPSGGNGGTGGAAPGQGGTGGALGGSGGALAQGGGAGQGGGVGQGGTGPGPIEPTGECADATGMQILYTNSSDNTNIGMTLQVQQTPPGAFLLNQLSVRYWFRDDDIASPFVGDVNFATQAGGVPLPVTFTFGEALGVNYAEMRFTSTSAIGAGIQTINVRIHAMSYAPLTLTNDPSFNAAAVAATLNENITAYVDTDHVFGCEPPAP